METIKGNGPTSLDGSREDLHSRGSILVPDDGVELVGPLAGGTLPGFVAGGCAEGPVAGIAQVGMIVLHRGSSRLRN